MREDKEDSQREGFDENFGTPSDFFRESNSIAGREDLGDNPAPAPGPNNAPFSNN